jgi:hypothetical protein
MSVFEQLEQTTVQAREQELLAPAQAERILAIASHSLNYKHLGLELHGLLAQLAPAVNQHQLVPPALLEEQLQRIEARYRRS